MFPPPVSTSGEIAHEIFPEELAREGLISTIHGPVRELLSPDGPGRRQPHDIPRDGLPSTPETEAGKPNSIRWASYFKPFGVLAYVLREPKDQLRKIEDKYVKAIFLGFTDSNSSWTFGFWKHNKQVSTDEGLKFTLAESRNAKFTDYRVSNLDHLKPGRGFWVPSAEQRPDENVVQRVARLGGRGTSS